jgi:hypothetical protein
VKIQPEEQSECQKDACASAPTTDGAGSAVDYVAFMATVTAYLHALVLAFIAEGLGQRNAAF